MQTKLTRKTYFEILGIACRSFGIFLCSQIFVGQVAKNLSMPLLQYFVLLVIPPVFYVLLEEYHRSKKKKVSRWFSTRPTLFLAIRSALWGKSFWYSAAPPLVMLTLWDWNGVMRRFLPSFATKNSLVFGGMVILCYGLPSLCLFLLAEGALRKDWYRHWKRNLFATEEDGLAKLPALPKGRLIFNLVVMTFLLGPTLFFFPMLAGVILMLGSVIFLSDTLTALFFLVLFGIPFLRWSRIQWKKRAFFRRIRKICRENGYELRWNASFFRGGYFCTCREEFQVETDREVFVGTFLPIHSLRAILYLYDTKRYQFEKRFFWWWIFYPKHSLALSRSKDAPGEKPRIRLVVMTREPTTVRYGDEELSRPVYCGDVLGDFTLHHAESFANWLDRLSLIRDSEKRR